MGEAQAEHDVHALHDEEDGLVVWLRQHRPGAAVVLGLEGSGGVGGEGLEHGAAGLLGVAGHGGGVGRAGSCFGGDWTAELGRGQSLGTSVAETISCSLAFSQKIMHLFFPNNNNND